MTRAAEPLATGRERETKRYRGTSLIRKRTPPRTLQKDYAWGPMVVLGGWRFRESVSSEGRRGRWRTPTMALHLRIQHREQPDHESP